MDIEKLKYPVGKFLAVTNYDAATIMNDIDAIAALPNQLAEIVKQMTAEKWSKPYRPDSWSARQVLHHVADSHMHAYLRFKFALTEDNPTIKPYNQDVWVQLPDTQFTDPLVSLHLIEALHIRWVTLMRNMSADDWENTYFHPEYKTTSALYNVVHLYAWHGAHHAGHLKIVADGL